MCGCLLWEAGERGGGQKVRRVESEEGKGRRERTKGGIRRWERLWRELEGVTSVRVRVYTVICFLFVAKIFSDTENVRKYFTRINFTRKIFARLAPGYTPALPQLLLPIYPCNRGSL